MRGQTAKVGDTRVSKNGYHYTKCATKWRLTHHIIAEQKLGRVLKENERVIFGEGGKRDLSPDNVLIIEKGSGTIARERARLAARIQELTAQLNELK